MPSIDAEALVTVGANLSSDRRSGLVREIVLHLIDCPDAKDTIDGILSCWLPGVNVEREEVLKTLDYLVSRGWVFERTITSSPQKVYGANKERLSEMRTFLNS